MSSRATLTWWGSLVRVQSRLPVLAEYSESKLSNQRQKSVRSRWSGATSRATAAVTGFVGLRGQVRRVVVRVGHDHAQVASPPELLQHMERRIVLTVLRSAGACWAPAN